MDRSGASYFSSAQTTPRGSILASPVQEEPPSSLALDSSAPSSRKSSVTGEGKLYHDTLRSPSSPGKLQFLTTYKF